MRRGCKTYWKMAVEQSGMCHYCGCKMWFGKVKTKADEQRADMATIDHIIPRSEGGHNGRNNIVLSCKACNLAKDNTMLVEPQKGAGRRHLKRLAKQAFKEYIAGQRR